MIGRLRGTVAEKAPPQLLLDVAGVGYEVDLPLSAFEKLPAEGGDVTVYTHFLVRDDAQLLYGFLSVAERDAFRTLIRITGVGPKLALSLLSGISLENLAAAVDSGDTAALIRIPGIGKKTAERLALELKGKLSGLAVSAPSTPKPTGARGDVMAALVSLGYTEREVRPAVDALAADVSVSDGIRLALRSLTKS